jgi:hypothetical protein
MEQKKKSIEIIDIDLGINIDEQIKKYASTDSVTNKYNINSILEKAKEKNMKLVDQCVIDKFEPLFEKLIQANTITKEEFVQFLNLQPLMIAPSISKFNKFLKDAKGGKFKFIVDKNSQDIKKYSLVNV